MIPSLIVAAFGIVLLFGCATSLDLPSSGTNPIKTHKYFKVYAHLPTLKKSGVHLEKGDLFTIIAAGSINTNPRRYPNRWQGPESRLNVMVGDRYYGLVFNATQEARSDGEILFYITDGFFDIYKGRALKPEWYKDNRGGFSVTIFVWKKQEAEHISPYMNDLAALNPDNEAVQDASKRTETMAEYYLAKIETENEVEKTKNQLGKLKKETDIGGPVSEPPSGDQKGAGEAVVHADGKDAQIASLEAKLAQLTATLAKLENLQQQLETERERSARLAQELESAKEMANDSPEDRFPPYLLVASPKDGLITAAARINISGVAEDDIGLQAIEIRLNDRLLAQDQIRGLKITGDTPVRRHEFNAQVSVDMGRNEITIRAIDNGGQVSEKIFIVKRQENRRNIWAVVVGIDAYAQVPRLKYAVEDALAVYQLLTTGNQIPEGNVTLLTNEQATLTNLRSFLGTRLKQSAGKDDMVIIYFAGHGATEPDVTSPDGDGLEKYILPYDADPKDLYASALPMREISHILSRIQSERLVFIADACYSGASGGRTISIQGFRSNLSEAFLNRISRGKGRVIITASGANEVSAEDDALKHGVFTYYLVEGLKGRADYDADGLITVDEAYRYVSEAVPRATNQDQHPVKIGSMEGQLVLGVAN